MLNYLDINLNQLDLNQQTLDIFVDHVTILSNSNVTECYSVHLIINGMHYHAVISKQTPWNSIEMVCHETWDLHPTREAYDGSEICHNNDKWAQHWSKTGLAIMSPTWN